MKQARDPPEWEEEEEGGGIIIDLSRRTLYSAAQLKKELDTREKVKNKEIDPKNPVDSSRGADKNWVCKQMCTILTYVQKFEDFMD